MCERREEFIFQTIRRPQRFGVPLAQRQQSRVFLGGDSQFIPLADHFLPLTIELEEHFCLAPQDVRLDRFTNKVDRSGFVAAESALRTRATRRHKDNRDASRSFGAANEFRQLKPVHLGHLHVDQREGDVVLQQQFQGVAAGAGLEQHQILAAQ